MVSCPLEFQLADAESATSYTWRHLLHVSPGISGHLQHVPTSVPPGADEEMLEEEAGHLAAEVARMRAVRTALAAATADAEAALATAQPGGALHPLAGQAGR
jgi:hypothetical protein